MEHNTNSMKKKSIFSSFHTHRKDGQDVQSVERAALRCFHYRQLWKVPMWYERRLIIHAQPVHFLSHPMAARISPVISGPLGSALWVDDPTHSRKSNIIHMSFAKCVFCPFVTVGGSRAMCREGGSNPL